MLKTRRVLGFLKYVALFAVMLILGTSTASAAVDWFLQCWEQGNPPTITAPAEDDVSENQNCIGDNPCGTNKACWGLGGKCIGTTDDANWSQKRTHDYGDCTTPPDPEEGEEPVDPEGCEYCQGNSELVCYVWYRFKRYGANGCSDRCAEPGEKHSEPGKCVP